MKSKDLLEAQFWWAFSCLAVVGRRNEENFQVEMVRRNSGFYPDAIEVDSIIQEASCHLALVLNRAKLSDGSGRQVLSGWERHLLALSTRPD